VSGLVTFLLGAQHYATPLTEVREVVRLQGLADLPGMHPPLAGVLDLRGSALPVLDLRPRPGERGDVLVVDRPDAGGSDAAAGDATTGGPVGVAVDAVRAVVRDDELPPAGGPRSDVLPSYVVEVLRGADGVVFLVDLQRMVEAAHRTPAAGSPTQPAPAQT